MNNKKNNIQGIVVIITFILIIAGGIFAINTIFDNKKNEIETEIKITDLKIKSNNKNSAEKEQLVEQQITSIDTKQQEIKSYKIQKTTTATDVTREVSKFRHFANDIENIKQQISSTPELYDNVPIMKKLEALTTSLIDIQIKNFPRLREAYAKAATRTMQKDNIVVEALGENNTTLEIIGERYLDTSNIIVDFNILSTQLTNLRFKSIRFKSSKDALPTITRSISELLDRDIGLY